MVMIVIDLSVKFWSEVTEWTKVLVEVINIVNNIVFFIHALGS
jgi:hypothetical protein